MKAQTVGGITASQVGEHIVIRYHIYDSNPKQLFEVSIYCSINGMPDTLLTNVSGDVGDIVPGGKSEYQALWNVLSDVKNLASADFLVQAELQKRNYLKSYSRFHITNATNDKEGNLLYVLLNSGVQANADRQMVLGARVGYMGKWGISAAFSGKTNMVHNADTDDWIWNDREKEPVPMFVTSIDLTKKIVASDATQLHLYAGPAFLSSKYTHEPSQTSYGTFAGIDGGFIANISYISISLGYTFTPNFLVPDKKINCGWLNFSIGSRFAFSRKNRNNLTN